jgi:phosphoribosylformylglycinamidine cyclo-ligase
VKITYQESGVDPAEADSILESFSDYLKSRPKDPNLLSGIGPYASCYRLLPLIKGMEDPMLVTSCDGVGTKVKLALDWNRIEGLGQDLVAMNVNDLLCIGARPFLFLDYYATGKLESKQLTVLLKSIQSACEASGCALAGGETAEMPGIYQGKDFDLAGFTVGIVDKKNILGGPRVKLGDALVALSSSGVHSNGFSLVRMVVEKEGLKPQEKNPFDGRTWSDTLLAPTTLYVKPLLPVLPSINGLAHITGGGLFGNLPRILSKGQKAIIDRSKWPFSPLFRWLQEKAVLNDRDCLETFNSGVGMIVALSQDQLNQFLEHCKTVGLTATQIGRIEADDASEPFVEWR